MPSTDEQLGPEGQDLPTSISVSSSVDIDGIDHHTLDDAPDANVVHFLEQPWCRAHLEAPGVRVVLPAGRRRGWVCGPHSITSDPKEPDNAFRRTLNTPDTIPAFVVFYETSETLGWLPPLPEIKAFVALGHGLSGHAGVLHGGFVTALLDEILGTLMPLNRRRAQHNAKHGLAPPPHDPHQPVRAPEDAAALSAVAPHGFVTGYLNTRYVRPVRTGTTVLLTARYVRREGDRKFYVEGTVWDEHANVCAKGDAVFIALRERL